MSTQIKIEELKTLIANGIREQNLHEVLPDDAVEKIKEKILAMRDKEAAESIPEVVSELNYATDNDIKFPDERELTPSPEQQVNISGETTSVDVAPGAVPAEQMSEPTLGYTPELPQMLQKAAPGELFVFQYNDVGESGENLSNKPMRLMDDPDVKKSMNDLWIQEGKTKAKVYVAKFEEMGEIEFNYADGTSKFTEKASLPDYAGGPEYKENPYAAESLPQIDAVTQNDLETYVKSSVDLEKVVHDIVMGIVKDSLMTNTEKAVEPNVMEDIAPVEDRFGNASHNAQQLRPMEESFTLSMEDVVKDEGFEKVVLPKGLNEAIKSGDKKMMVQENEHIQKWSFEDKEYYTPVNRLSKTKGYVLNLKTL
jgi:hypothetical protein